MEYITDEHRKAKKKVPSRKEDNLIIKSQRRLKQGLTILMWIISIQLRLPKAVYDMVNSDFVYKQLLHGCKAYKTTLFLTQCQRERLIGLASILYLSCQNCRTVTMVKTSTWHLSEKCTEIYTQKCMHLRCSYLVCIRYVYEVPAIILLASQDRALCFFWLQDFFFVFE